MSRSDQRAKGETFLRGLLVDGRRKSMQPMAERLGVDHQGLQQFVTTSTWDTTAVRTRIARRAVEVVEPVAWVDDTRFQKDGKGFARGGPAVLRRPREGRQLPDRRVLGCRLPDERLGVGVPSARPTGCGHVQRRDDQGGVMVRAHRVVEDAPRVQVDDGGHCVEPTLID
jgi:hypothetical protein